MSSEYTLSDYVSLIRGTTYKGDLVNLPGPVLLGLASIQPDGGFRWGAFKTYGGECPAKITLKSGDLYVSLKDVTQSGDLLGSVARIPKQIESGRLTQDTVKLELSGRAINPSYLYWMLRTPQYREYCRSRATGTTTLGLAREDFLAFPIADPKPEQDSLVELLEGIEERIELLAETNATLESIAQALFKSWFVDFDPVHANAGTQAPSLPPEIQALFPATFTGSPQGLIPEGWINCEIGDYLDVLATGRRPKGGVASFSEGIPSIGAESINGIGKFDFAKTKFVPLEFFEKMKSGLVEDYDVLLYKDGGKPGEFKPRVSMFGNSFPFETFAINEHVFRMRSNYLGQAFLYFYVSHEKTLSELRNRGGKAAIPGINQTDVKTLKLLAPTKNLLDEFQTRVEPLLSTILANASLANTFAKLRDSLLPRLISGQLRLPEAEQAIAAITD